MIRRETPEVIPSVKNNVSDHVATRIDVNTVRPDAQHQRYVLDGETFGLGRRPPQLAAAMVFGRFRFP